MGSGQRTVGSDIEGARNLGSSSSLLDRWRHKDAAEGDKPRFAILEAENKALRLKNAEQVLEIDLLKKASAYFVSLHKGSTRSFKRIQNMAWQGGRPFLWGPAAAKSNPYLCVKSTLVY